MLHMNFSFTDHKFHYYISFFTKLNQVFKNSKIDEMKLVIVECASLADDCALGLLLCREPLKVLSS